MEITQKANAPEHELRTRASALTWMFWGVITLPIGLPCWVLGAFIGVDALQTVWARAALLFVEAFHGKQEVEEAPVSTGVQDYLQYTLDANNLLNLVACSDGYIQRFIRHVDERGFVKRIELTVIVPGELGALGMENTLESALRYTLVQIQQGVFKESGALGLAEIAPSQPQSKPEVTSASEPQQAKKSQTDSPQTGDVGKVIFAGVREFPPKRKGDAPYRSFAVRLQTDDGQEVEFSGVDLEARFSGDDPFKKGDRLRIVRRGKQPVEVEEAGQRVTRFRNCFGVYRA